LNQEPDDDSTLIYLEKPGKTRFTATYSFYIKGAGAPIIVDTFVRDPKNAPPGMPGIDIKPEWDFVEQLRRVGVRSEDVGAVILTHLHWDHCGNNGLFPNAKIYLQREELMHAATFDDPRSMSLFDKTNVVDLVGKYRDRLVLLDGDREIADGVKCVRVGGHTPGSQAVYVETSEGTAIITGDACFVYDNLERNIPVGIFFRYDECIKAMDRFRREGKFILVGHDTRVLERYPKVPP
jgi:N-acyl homoserine lactone hydrolase